MPVTKASAGVPLYVPSDTIVSANDAEHTGATAGLFKFKEIQLISRINGGSKFRFVFDGLGNGVGTWGQVYRNGTAIGTQQSFPADGTYHTYTEDINASNFQVGEYLQVYVNIPGISTTKVRNFRLEGTESLWYNSVV